MTTKHATATHTPAPWTACDDVAGRLIAVAAWESAAIIAHTVPGQPVDVRAANARLIAAAPAMLAELREAADMLLTVIRRLEVERQERREAGHHDSILGAYLPEMWDAQVRMVGLIAKATGAQP